MIILKNTNLVRELTVLVISLVSFSFATVAQEPVTAGKTYASFVKQLEGGATEINYTEFRHSFLESEEFNAAGKLKSALEALRNTLRQQMQESKHAEIVETAKKMLKIDYTDMEAHKILRQTYKILGDAGAEKKHHAIQFGLLKSIVQSGDGQTPETAWPVIQISEEYFILNMIGARLLRQSIDNTHGICDKMEVETPEGKKTYYFNITKLMVKRQKEVDQANAAKKK